MARTKDQKDRKWRERIAAQHKNGLINDPSGKLRKISSDADRAMGRDLVNGSRHEKVE